MKNRLYNLLINIVIRGLYKGVTAKDILRKGKDGRIYFRNKPLSEDQIKALKEQATVIYESSLWPILYAEAEYRAVERGFLKSKDNDDLIVGKVMLYTNDLYQDVLKRIKNL